MVGNNLKVGMILHMIQEEEITIVGRKRKNLLIIYKQAFSRNIFPSIFYDDEENNDN